MTETTPLVGIIIHNKYVEGKLYNEPEILSADEAEKLFGIIGDPMSNNIIDTGCLIRRTEQEMQYLQLSTSTAWQYM